MTRFTDADIAAATSAESVHLSELFEVDFKSGVRRYTTEIVGFTDVNGNKWESQSSDCGNAVLSASGYSSGQGGVEATQVVYRISTSDEAAAELFLDEDESEYRGRAIRNLVQIFDCDANPIGEPIAFPVSYMDHLSVSWTPDNKVSITLSCEGLFTMRNAPRYGYITDQHQKALYPTDRGLERQHLARGDTHYQWPV